MNLQLCGYKQQTNEQSHSEIEQNSGVGDQ